MGASQFQRDRDGSMGLMGSDSRSEGQDSETLRARVATELRTVEQLQRIARPAAMIIFALLGLLVLLQLYTWTRVEQLAALGQQREQRAAAAEASMQEAIDKQRVALDEAIQQSLTPGHGHKMSAPLAQEAADRGASAAPRPAPKPVSPKKELQPAHKAVQSPAPAQPAPVQLVPARQAPAPPPEVPAPRQNSAVAYQVSQASQRDLPANRQETAAPPTSQGVSVPQGPGAVENAEHEAAEGTGLRPGHADSVIARDHAEIERLRKLGKRDYIEFTLVRSGSRQEVAPDISLELRKVDLKRLRCSLSVYAEDYEYPTDLAINEPVVFPVRAMWDSVELVINRVGKDSVGGYLTARKGVLQSR